MSSGEEDDHNHVMRKIDKCGKELQKWERDCFGNMKMILSRKRKKLKEVEKLAIRTGNNQHVRVLQKEIEELIDKENRLWFQRAKVTWAKFGDRNSKFFHNHASQRRRKNLIRQLKDPSGQVFDTKEDIIECLVNYY